MYTQTQNQSHSIKLLMVLVISAMLIGFTTLQVMAQDEDAAVEEVTQEVNNLRAQHSALKAQVDAGEITKEEARAQWKALIDEVRGKKKAAFDRRIERIQTRYERIAERNPELAEKLRTRIDSAHSRRTEVAENRRVLNQRVRDGEVTREEARTIHRDNAQAVREKMAEVKTNIQETREGIRERREERRDGRTPPPDEPEAN